MCISSSLGWVNQGAIGLHFFFSWLDQLGRNRISFLFLFSRSIKMQQAKKSWWIIFSSFPFSAKVYQDDYDMLKWFCHLFFFSFQACAEWWGMNEWKLPPFLFKIPIIMKKSGQIPSLPSCHLFSSSPHLHKMCYDFDSIFTSYKYMIYYLRNGLSNEWKMIYFDLNHGRTIVKWISLFTQYSPLCRV